MPRGKNQPMCEIIFAKLRIPVFDKEKGKQVIEGIFMIGETGKSETKAGGRKRGRRKAKSAKAAVRVKRPGRGKKMKRTGRPKEKGMKPAEIVRKPGVAPVTVG